MLHFLTPHIKHRGVEEIFQSIFRAIIDTLPRHVLNFRYVAAFRNQSASTGVENRDQISHFLTLLYKSDESDGRNVSVNVSCDT